MIDHSIQRQILINVKFFKDGARYSEIRPNNVKNDIFNYHLQYLAKKKYLIKEGELYKLTEKGKSIATNIDDLSFKINTNYKVSVYICPVVGKNILLTRRLKHPQFGYVGLVSGKMGYGERILDAAQRELQEETNLKAKFKIIGNLHQIRKNDKGELIEDGIFYICFTNKSYRKVERKGQGRRIFLARNRQNY